jgi:glycolate oxidase FAD binding subunit
MVAAGLAGPARATAGGVRDHVLGATVLNGRGELLTFGGQVMKNVAGYDVSRLMAGSMGVLGVLCEVSLKVLPVPVAQLTLEHRIRCHAGAGLAGGPTRRAAAHHGQQLVPGPHACAPGGCSRRSQVGGLQLGGRAIDANEAAAWWRDVRDHRPRASSCLTRPP